MPLFLSFIIAFFVSIALIPVMMYFAEHLKMMDVPSERKVHTQAVPRTGGIGLAIGAMMAISVIVPFNSEITSIIIGGSIIILFGLIDDMFDINYKWKFLGQFIAVAVVVFAGVTLKILPFLGNDLSPLWLSIPLSIFFIIGVTNAVNLSDGLDGLAAGIMLMSFSAIAFLALMAEQQNIGLMAIAMTGGIVGFLRFNAHPALVFMGDAGSQFIGFMAVTLVIYLTQSIEPTLNPAMPLFILGLPILDTISVIVQRIRQGDSPFSPDKRHIHHKLLNYGFTHGEAVGAIYVLQSSFLALGFYLRYQSDAIVLGTYLLICGVILFSFYLAGKFVWKLHSVRDSANNGINCLRCYPWLYPVTKIYLDMAVSLFLALFSCYLLLGHLKLSYQLALIISVSLIVFYLLPKTLQAVTIRLSIYFSAFFSAVFMGQSTINFALNWFIDGYFVLLIAVLVIAIRITRKSRFRITNVDLLIGLFGGSAIVLIEVEYLEHALFRILCLGFTLEYLFHRSKKLSHLVQVTAITSGLLIIIVMLPELKKLSLLMT